MISNRRTNQPSPRRALRGMRLLFAGLASVALACALPARADDDLPARVGRLASVQGSVYHAPDEQAGDWSGVVQNDPVAEGDNLWVDRDGHAEIDYGGGQFRLAGDTNVHVSRLDDRQLALFVAAGRVIVRVRVLEPEDAVRIDTPASQISLTRPGLYRIDVASGSPSTTVIVREGEAQVATAEGTESVFPGQMASLSGVAGERADIRGGPGIDGFDAWSAARDRIYERPRQNAYVSRQMIGQADLDTYGTWQTYPDYGAVWFPTSVEVDWAPYRFGRWTWLRGFGYTWVDDAPWGYAPFHYGRWAYIGSRWGWCPGAYVARPAWAPAFVAWYGGDGFGYGAGGPVYGWVPLGWREPFVPWWGNCSARCYSRLNRPYAVNVAERRNAPLTRYANWSVPGGTTAVAGAALAVGKPIAANRVPIAANTAFAPALMTTPPAVKPAPARPLVARPGNGVPAPASTLYSARTLQAPALSSGRAPTPPAIAPAPAAGDRARGVPPAMAQPGSATPRVAQPQTQPIAPAPRVVPAPAPMPQTAAPVARITPAPAATPQTAAPLPRVAPAPTAPIAAPVPRVVPAPVPAPQAVAPLSQPAPPAERARAAPPNQKGPERQSN